MFVWQRRYGADVDGGRLLMKCVEGCSVERRRGRGAVHAV